MPRFLIEVPHEPTQLDCARAVKIFLKTGSHFFTHADWGCKDGEHKAWLLVDIDNKEEARRIVPPGFQSQAKIVQLCTFTLAEIDEILNQYEK